MFAVPGWSISASSLKTQTAPVNPKSAQNNTAKSDQNDGETSNKKRKRGGSGKSQAKEVNTSNVADMWERVIEGKPKPKKPKVPKQKESDTGAVQDGKESGLSTQTNGDERLKKSKTKEDKKREKNLRAEEPNASADQSAAATLTTAAAASTPLPAAPKLTPLQASMRQKLISARFRHLNQTLYTNPSSHSLSLISSNPEMFNEYHEGFRRQVEVWPENPVEGYISYIKSRGKVRGPQRGPGASKATKEGESNEVVALPRTNGRCNIADLGCGDAGIATALHPTLKKLNLKIYSYDLHSPTPLVTAADIANLPLPENSIDVAIFCLALMGSNWIDFIEEAFRILRWKGELWIAEIKSRFGRVGKSGNKGKVVSHSVGNRKRPIETKEAKKATQKAEEAFDDDLAAVEVDGVERPEETDVSAFVEVLRKRGLVLRGEGKEGNNGKEGLDLRNKMFVKMWFVKATTPIKGKCVPVPKGMEEATGQTWTRKQKGKFIENEDEGIVSSEAGVLKPCVYKLR